jgi:hypothetical protein
MHLWNVLIKKRRAQRDSAEKTSKLGLKESGPHRMKNKVILDT